MPGEIQTAAEFDASMAELAGFAIGAQFAVPTPDQFRAAAQIIIDAASFVFVNAVRPVELAVIDPGCAMACALTDAGIMPADEYVALRTSALALDCADNIVPLHAYRRTKIDRHYDGA